MFPPIILTLRRISDIVFRMNGIYLVRVAFAALIILFIDLCVNGFFEQPFSWFLLAYCLIGIIITSSRTIFCMLAVMAAVDSLLLYGNFALMPVSLIPLALAGRLMMQVINAPVMICGLSVSGAIAAQRYLIDPFIRGQNSGCMRYTMISIAVTLIGSGCFYLKFQKR